MKNSLLTVALGGWLISIALTFGSHPHSMIYSDIVSGILLIVFGLLSVRRVSFGWAVGCVGVWLQLAPVLFWAKAPLIYLNDTLVGVLAIILSFLLAKPESTQAQEPNAIPLGWSYNPSSWSHRIPTVGLAMLCWFFSRYMAAYQLGYIDDIWDPFFKMGTLDVITSKISRDFPVSDAGLGAVCYATEAVLGWQGDRNRWLKMPWLVFAFGFLVIPVGIVSVILIILQPVAVGAWCSWCLATALSMLLMIVLTAGELVAVLRHLKQSKRRWVVFWQGGAVEKQTASKRYSLQPNMGIRPSWALVGTFILGIYLMASPALLGFGGVLATVTFIGGPLIAAISVIATAGVFRSLRFLNIPLSLSLVILPWFTSQPPLISVSHSIVGILIFILSLPLRRVSC